MACCGGVAGLGPSGEVGAVRSLAELFEDPRQIANAHLMPGGCGEGQATALCMDGRAALLTFSGDSANLTVAVRVPAPPKTSATL